MFDGDEAQSRSIYSQLEKVGSIGMLFGSQVKIL